MINHIGEYLWCVLLIFLNDNIKGTTVKRTMGIVNAMTKRPDADPILRATQKQNEIAPSVKGSRERQPQPDGARQRTTHPCLMWRNVVRNENAL